MSEMKNGRNPPLYVVKSLDMLITGLFPLL